MQIIHAKSITIADATGTATGWFGATTVSVPATALQRPSDWNSAHNLGLTLAGGNTTQNSTWTGTNLSYSAAGAMTLGLNGNTLLFSAGKILSFYAAHSDKVWIAGQYGGGTMQIQPMYIPYLSFDRLCIPIFISATSNVTGTMTLSVSVGLFTRNGSTMSLYASTSATTTQSYSGSSNNSTYIGMRLQTIPWSTSLPEDQYYVGYWSRTTTGGGNASVSNFLVSKMNSVFSGPLGASSNSSYQLVPGLGIFSASFTTAMPNSFAISQINGTGSFFQRPPVIYFQNGTF